MIEAWIRKLAPIANPTLENAIQVPARLIDLHDDGGLRIVHTSNLESYDGGFAALSYVWGTNQTFVLLSTTECSLTTKFTVEQLPQTIRDAVVVTRRIGLRYLWVDAL
jgi:hypothetical protein